MRLPAFLADRESRARRLLPTTAFVLALVVSFAYARFYFETSEQPLNFSHERHVLRNDPEERRDCLFCHVPGYEEPAGLPANASRPVRYAAFLKSWRAETRDPARRERRRLHEPPMRIPTLQYCETCHDASDDDDGGSDDDSPNAKNDDEKKAAAKKKKVGPSLRLLREHIKQNRPIAWRRLHRLDANIFFSHARHIGPGALDCESCHGDMSRREKSLTRAEPGSLDMKPGCMNCHERSGGEASNDCIACHK